MKIFNILLALLLTLSTGTHAATAGSWTKVDQLYTPTDEENVFVYFGANSMPGCYNNNGAYILNNSTTNTDRLYSTVLAAKMANKDIQPFFEVIGSNIESWSRCKLVAVYVR